MNPNEFRAELEYDLKWRQDEMRFLRNQLSSNTMTKEEDRKRYRKVLAVMLYSHFEGFCKDALITYIDAINGEQIKCSDANEYIATASLQRIFQDLEHPNKATEKCDEFFKSNLDKGIYDRFSRHVHLIRELNNLLDRQVNISNDIVNTKSNLNITIMNKNLYCLGLFKYQTFDGYESIIKNLLARRNSIAHGEQSDLIKEDEYEEFENVVNTIISDLMVILTNAVREKYYLNNLMIRGSSTSISK